MGMLWGSLDWRLGESDPETEAEIAVLTGNHPDPNATTAARDSFAQAPGYVRREQVLTMLAAGEMPGTGGSVMPVPVPTPVPASLPTPMPLPAVTPVVAPMVTPVQSQAAQRAAEPAADGNWFWGGIGAWFSGGEHTQDEPRGSSVYGISLAGAQKNIEYLPGGEQDVFSGARNWLYSSGAVTAAVKTVEEEQIWRAPWNIGHFVNPLTAAEAAVDVAKPWWQQVEAVGAFGQAVWGDIEHNPLIGPPVQLSTRTGATVLYGGLQAVGDLITTPIGGHQDERTGVIQGGLSVLEAARGLTQVVVAPLISGPNPEPMAPDPALSQPLNHDLGYMYAYEAEQRAQRAYQQYLHDKQVQGNPNDVAASLAEGAGLGVGLRPNKQPETLGEYIANLGTLPQVYAGMQAARDPEAYSISLGSLSPEEAEAWRMLQRSAWGVRDTQGPGWLNVAQSYTANVRFIQRKDEALAKLDQDIRLMGILAHATVDLGRTADDEVRKVLADNGLEFMLRGMPFALPAQPSAFGTWGRMQPPADDTWMYRQDPVYGQGWQRSEDDYLEALMLLGRAGELQVVDSAGGMRYMDPVHQWLYERGLIGTAQYSNEQLAAAYAQDRTAKSQQAGLRYGLVGPQRDPHQFGINPQVFGMTQNDVDAAFEDIRERAGAVQTLLRVQRNELRTMDQLDWQGKMLDWRPLLLWGMLLDPFDWYARGADALGLSSKALRRGLEHFGVVELQQGDAVNNIVRGAQGRGPVRTPGDVQGMVTMHGGLGFVNPAAGAGIPEAGYTADDIIEMVAEGARLDAGTAIRARARIHDAFVHGGLIDGVKALGGEAALPETGTLAEFLAQTGGEARSALGLLDVAQVDDLSDLSGYVYKGLAIPAHQQLRLPHGFGELDKLWGADTATLALLQKDIASRFVVNMFREPSRAEVLTDLAHNLTDVPVWQRDAYGYLSEAAQALSREDPAYVMRMPWHDAALENHGAAQGAYRTILGMAELAPETGIHVDVYNVGYDPETKSLLVPMRLDGLEDDSLWLMGNMHKNPKAVTRAAMTTDIAWLKHELWGVEEAGGGNRVPGGPLATFEQLYGTQEQYVAATLHDLAVEKSKAGLSEQQLASSKPSDWDKIKASSVFGAGELAQMEAEIKQEYQQFRNWFNEPDESPLPNYALDRIVRQEVGEAPIRNNYFFDIQVLEHARRLATGYDAEATEFFRALVERKPDRFRQAQELLYRYGVWLNPQFEVTENGKRTLAAVGLSTYADISGANYAAYRDVRVGADTMGPAPALPNPYTLAFDQKTYWDEQWQLSGGRRAEKPNFAEYPSVPEVLLRTFDNTEGAIRLEKSQAAAAQVGIYNAEKWLFEMLAGAPADLPRGSKITASYIDAQASKGWALLDGTGQMHAPPAVGQVDLKTLMLADVVLEQKGLDYYIDWDAVTRGAGGYDLANVPLIKGRPEQLQPSAWRSGYLRMDDKLYQAQTVVQHTRVGPRGVSAAGAASQLDRIRVQMLPELMETWEAGGKGSMTVGAPELGAAYRDLSRAAVDAGLVVELYKPTKLDDGSYQLNYRLRTLAAGDEAWARASGDPAKVMQGFKAETLAALEKYQPQVDRLVAGFTHWKSAYGVTNPIPYIGATTVGSSWQPPESWVDWTRGPVAAAPYQMSLGLVQPWMTAPNPLQVAPPPLAPEPSFAPGSGLISDEFMTRLPAAWAAPGQGPLPATTDFLTILKQGNDPNYLYMTPVDGSAGLRGDNLVLKNQEYGASRGWTFYGALETLARKYLVPIFGTPQGAGATTPVLTRAIPHGGSLEFAPGENAYTAPAQQAASVAQQAAKTAEKVLADASNGVVAGMVAENAVAAAEAAAVRAAELKAKAQPKKVEEPKPGPPLTQAPLDAMVVGSDAHGRQIFYVAPGVTQPGPMSQARIGPIKWPGEQTPGSKAFGPGTGIASSRGRKAGQAPAAHDAHLMGPRLPITEEDWQREAENAEKFDVWGTDETVPGDPDRAGYALAGENREAQRLENKSAWDLEFGGKSMQDSGYLSTEWLGDDDSTLAGMEVQPAPPKVPYGEMPRALSEYDQKNGLLQFYIDRVEMFRDSQHGPNPPAAQLVQEVEAALASVPLIKVARDTLETFAGARGMTRKLIGGYSGVSPVAGEWIWNEAKKQAEWVARQINIRGTGVHVDPNPALKWGEGWSLEFPAGSYTSATPITLTDKEAKSAYQLRPAQSGGAADEFWWWGAHYWYNPAAGQAEKINVKGAQVKNWTVVAERPNYTVIRPALSSPWYYADEAHRYRQMPESWRVMDLDEFDVHVPDEEWDDFKFRLTADEGELAAQERAWPFLFTPAHEFARKFNFTYSDQVPDSQLYTPWPSELAYEAEVARLAKKAEMELKIRSSVPFFHDNIAWLENYIRKTMGVTDPDEVADLLRTMYDLSVQRHQEKAAAAAAAVPALVNLKQQQDAFDEFLLAIQEVVPPTTAEGWVETGRNYLQKALGDFAKWVDAAPKDLTPEEVAAMAERQAQRVEQAEMAADNYAWEVNRARLAQDQEQQATRLPGKGNWQIVGTFDDVAVRLQYRNAKEGDAVFAVYPQTRIAPASFQPWWKGMKKIPEEQRELYIAQAPWLTSGFEGEYVSVVPEGWAPPVKTASPVAEVGGDVGDMLGPPAQIGPQPKNVARKQHRWADHWKLTPLPGQADDGTVTMHGGFGWVKTDAGQFPAPVSSLTPEEKEAVRTLNKALQTGQRTYDSLREGEWELMFRAWEGGGFGSPRPGEGWPAWAAARREKWLNYDSWVRSHAPRGQAGVRPFSGNASAISSAIGGKGSMTAADFAANLHSSAGKGAVYAPGRMRILDVVPQENGQYVVIAYETGGVTAYVMDDVMPQILATDKVVEINRGVAFGVGVESPLEKRLWLGEHGVMPAYGASIENTGLNAVRGSQYGYAAKATRAEQLAAIEAEAAQRAAQAAVPPAAEVTPDLTLEPGAVPGSEMGGPAAQATPAPDGVYAGTASLLRELGYRPEEIAQMTQAEARAVLARGGDWFNDIGQPAGEDIAVERAVTGAGPVTGSFAAPATQHVEGDRIGWTLRVRNEQGLSAVGLVVDEAEAGAASMYLVRMRNGQEQWISDAHAQFLTPANAATRAAALAQTAAPVGARGPAPGMVGPYTPGTALPAGPKLDIRIGRTVKVQGEDGQVTTGVLTDTDSDGYELWGRVRLDDGSEGWYRRDQFEYEGPATIESMTPKPAVTGTVKRGVSDLQLGVFGKVTDLLPAAYADAMGTLQTRNIYEQMGADTYRVGGVWRGPLAQSEGAPPQFHAGDVVVAGAGGQSERAQIYGVGTYEDPIFGLREGYKLHDGRVVPAESVRGLIARNPLGAPLAPEPLQMTLIEQAQMRKAYASGGAVGETAAAENRPVELEVLPGAPGDDAAAVPVPFQELVAPADAAAGAGREPRPSTGPSVLDAPPPVTSNILNPQAFGAEPDDWEPPAGIPSSTDEVPPPGVEGAAPARPATGAGARELDVAPDSTGAPLMITQRVRGQLIGMGYSSAEVNAMQPEEAWAVIDAYEDARVGTGAVSGAVSGAGPGATGAGAGGAGGTGGVGARGIGAGSGAVGAGTGSPGGPVVAGPGVVGPGIPGGAGAGGAGGVGGGAGGAWSGGGRGNPGGAAGSGGGGQTLPPGGAAGALGAGPQPWYQQGLLGAANAFFGPGGGLPNALTAVASTVGMAGGAAGRAAGAAGGHGYNTLFTVAQWVDNRMPWADTAKTKAAKFRDQWGMVASMFTSATTDQMELSFLMDAWAADPEGFMARGVDLHGAFAQDWKRTQQQLQTAFGSPRSLSFANLEAQADEFGYFSFDPRLFGNEETAATLPIIYWMSPAFGNFAQTVRSVPAQRWGGGELFANMFSSFLDDAGTAYYGMTAPGPLGKVLKTAGDLQRHVQAETVLNLNPGNWIGNWIGAWATTAYEGYGSLKTTDEFIRQTYNLFNAAPTERLRDSLEGRPTGSQAHLTWSESRLFRPSAWLQGLEPLVQFFTPRQNKQAVDAWFGQAEAMADRHNPLAFLALASDTTNRWWTTMTHVPGTGGRVRFGEAANYWGVFGAAQEDALDFNLAHAVDQTLLMMTVDDVLAASPEGQAAVTSIMGAVPTAAGEAMSRSAFATELQKVIGTVQDPDVKARLQTYVGDMLLHDFDTAVFAALRTGFKGANKVMLNPEYQKNIDTWMAPFFAFHYFTTRTAANWAGRILTDPRALGWWSRWERASDQYAEQNEVPIRYRGYLPGPNGFMLSNPINFLLGINKMMAGAPPNPDRAENLGDLAQQWAGMLNLRFMPGWTALLAQDPRNLWGGFFPQGEMVGQLGVLAQAAGGMLLNTMYEDDYAAMRKGRAIGASTITTGDDDYDVQQDALLALQALLEAMYGMPPTEEMTPGSQAALAYGERKVAFEGLVAGLSRFLGGYTVKAPIDPDEQSALALSGILKAVMPAEGAQEANWDAWKYIAALYPGLSVWHAQGDLYPTDTGYPETEPADRIKGVRPAPPMISRPAYAGFEWPVWDTDTGRLLESAQDSPFAEPGDNTAIYMLVDPRTGRVRYVGQSVAPSERINQHIEEFDEKGWDHPKTAWIGDMLRQGVYPTMYVFDWQPGSPKLNFDRADQMEQLWIGFLYYELGNRVWTDSVNVSIPERATWEQLVVDAGMTKEQMRQTFVAMQENPATWDRVRLGAEPKLARSPFSGLFPSLPRPGMPQAAPEEIVPDYGVNFHAYLPGEVGPKTTELLHGAGINTWEDLANPASQAKLAGLKGVSEGDAADWMAHANLTLAVQRGEAMVPTDGQEHEPDSGGGEFLVYPLTPAAVAAGEDGAAAAIAASGQGGHRHTQNTSYLYMPAIAGGAAPMMVTAGLATGLVYTGDVSRSAAAPALPFKGQWTSTGASAFPTTPEYAPNPQVTLADLKPAQTRAGTPAPNPHGPGQASPFATTAAMGTGQQKPATVLENGKRPSSPLVSPFSMYTEAAKPYTVGVSSQPAFNLERDAQIAAGKERIKEVKEGFAASRPPADPLDAAMGAGGLLSWIFTPSPEVAAAPDYSGVYYFPERTRMESDAAARQSRAYYDEVNQRANTSLVAGGTALLGALGYTLMGGLVGSDNARLFFKGAALGGTWWAGQAGYLGWDLGKRGGGGPAGPVIPAEGTPPTLGPKKSNKFVYIPGWRPNVKPGVKFELPALPDGTQIWVPANMLAVEGTPGHNDADWLNNPQFDPAHPEASLARIQEVYGKAQPVPLAWLAREGAFFGPGPHLDTDQPRTVLTGRRALAANPYGVGGASGPGGYWETQGAPDPATQPELYANWAQEVLKPRGEYGIWLRSPLGGDPLLVEGYGDNKEAWQAQGLAGHAGLDYAVKPMTTVAASAPGQVVAVGENAEFGRFVIVQHDWGATIYGNLSGIGVVEGDWLAAGDTLGMAGGLDVQGNKGDTFHFGMQVAGVTGPEGMAGWVDPTPYLPSSGNAGASGWRWEDVPGVSRRLAEMLNDAGIANPDQIFQMDPAEAAARVDQAQAELGEKLDAQGGWELVRSVHALLSMGSKPQELIDAEAQARQKARHAAGNYWGGLEGPGTDPNAQHTGTGAAGSASGSNSSSSNGKDDGDIDDDGIRDLWDDDVQEPAPPPAKVMGKILAASGEGVNGTSVPWSKARAGMRVQNLNSDLYPGLTPDLIGALHAAHIYSVEQLLEIAEWDNAVDAIAGIQGIGKETAKTILRGAIQYDVRRRQIAKGETPNERLQEGMFNGLGAEGMAAAKGLKIYDVAGLAQMTPAELAGYSKDDNIGDATARALINQARAWQGLEPLPDEGEEAVTLDTIIAPGQVKGVGPAMVETLNGQGIYTYRDALAKGKDAVDAVKGMGEATLGAFWAKVVAANGGADPAGADERQNLEDLKGVGKKTEQALYEAGIINEQGLLELETAKEIAALAEQLGELAENSIDISAAGLTEIINEARKRAGLDLLSVPARNGGGAATVESIKGSPDDLRVLVGMNLAIAARLDPPIDQLSDLDRYSDDALQSIFGVDQKTVAKWRDQRRAEAEARAQAGEGAIVGGEPVAPAGAAAGTATGTPAPGGTADILNEAQQRATGTATPAMTPGVPAATPTPNFVTPGPPPAPGLGPQMGPAGTPGLTPVAPATPDSLGSVVDPSALARSFSLDGQLSGFTALSTRGTVREMPLGTTPLGGRPKTAGSAVGGVGAGAGTGIQQVSVDEDEIVQRVLSLFWRDVERNMRAV